MKGDKGKEFIVIEFPKIGETINSVIRTFLTYNRKEIEKVIFASINSVVSV